MHQPLRVLVPQRLIAFTVPIARHVRGESGRGNGKKNKKNYTAKTPRRQVLCAKTIAPLRRKPESITTMDTCFRRYGFVSWCPGALAVQFLSPSTDSRSAVLPPGRA